MRVQLTKGQQYASAMTLRVLFYFYFYFYKDNRYRSVSINGSSVEYHLNYIILRDFILY